MDRAAPSIEQECLSLQSPPDDALAHAIVGVCEAERRRIGAELHDGVGQYLTGIACLAAALRDQLAADGSRLVGKADTIARLVNDAIELTRAQARGLCPVQVEECGLEAALEDLTSQVERMHRITCVFENDGAPPELEPSVAQHLFRITQEAINNAVRHGAADRIVVRIRTLQAPGRLVIEDNGRGFRTARPALGLGLRLMAHRAAFVGGTLRIYSRPSCGTRVDCTFPLGRV